MGGGRTVSVKAHAEWRRRALVAFGLISAFLVTSLASVAITVVAAPPAEARYAQGGDGLYPGYIDWFEWGADGEDIPNGTSITNTRTIGLNVIRTTCTLTGLDGQVNAYRPGVYRGDALDNLYNVGGIDDANTLVSGIANSVNASTVEFDFDCQVTLGGDPVNIAGLVVADAESNNASQGEYIEATPAQAATFRVIDRTRTCDTSTIATTNGPALRLESDGTQCSEVNNGYGPIAVGFMEGATGAHITMHGGGLSAVALGVVFESDFGDAPLTYGPAGALLQSDWTGGLVGAGTTNVSDDSFELGVPGAYTPRLGDTVDSDGAYLNSPMADEDDTTGNEATDEDGIAPPGVVDTDFGETYTLDVACLGPGYLSGWIDWNNNGNFEASERSGAFPCDDTATSDVTLTWTVPDDAVQTVDEPTFMRLRVADTVEAAEQHNGISSRGEVEDYPIYVDLPDPGLTITKEADTDRAVPGDTVEYEITIENTGEVDYVGNDLATFTDDLSDVLDDAVYNNDEFASSGSVEFSDPVLDWSGELLVGESATITYSVDVNDPISGTGILDNTVVGPEESNCADGSTDPACTVEVPIAQLEIVKDTGQLEEATPGDVLTYTVTVTNTGQAAYTEDTPASFTDDLSDVIDDATYNDDAAAPTGDVTYTEPTLEWEGPLGVGESVQITYSVTVNEPLTGDGTMINSVVGPPESNCDTQPQDPSCTTTVPIRALEIVKTSDGSDGPLPGDTVEYEITVTNTGDVDYTVDDPAAFDDDLSDILDDAVYNGDALASSGDVTVDGTTLHWEGPLAAGESATITYSVDVNDPLSGNGTLFNVVVGPDESNCTDPDEQTDPDCIEPNPLRQLDITKTSDPVEEVLPGDTVTYEVTVENTGTFNYTDADPASFDDDLAAVLDDATYNADAAAPSGSVSYAGTVLSWEGALDAGDSVTVTYSVTVNDPLTGDGVLTNAVTGPPESNCDTQPLAEECTTEVLVKALEIVKSSTSATALQGDTVTYTVTVTNIGEADYTADAPASFDDDLTEVLDDAVYNDDASAPSGTVAYVEPVLSWEGALASGESVTVTYTVTVNEPLTGDATMTNTVTGPPESNCDAQDAGPECEVVVPIGALEILKEADPSGEVLPGGTVEYEITIENTGEVDFTGLTLTDDLTEVLDDAVYNADAAASAGAVSFASPTLTWTGAIAVGEAVEVTYSVTVNDPLTGDGVLTNGVVGPEGSNCEDGSTDPDCSTDVPVKALEIVKEATPSGEVLPGDSVEYTVTVTNIGEADYTTDAPASFTDDLSAVLDDAVYNDDAAAPSGAVSYAEPMLSWEGALAAGATVEVTYSVTVNDPLAGDGTLTNAVVGPPESNCDDGTEEECTTDVPVKALELVKVASPADEVLPGDTVEYTVTVTNIGDADYTAEDPAAFEDDLTEVLDDATYNGDASAPSGTVAYVEPVLSWEGALASGDSIDVTYSFTVNDPPTGDAMLTNAVLGPPESNCEDGSTDPDCTTDVPVRMLELVKTSDGDGIATPGETVTYSVTITNTGEVDYTAEDPAAFDDDLTEVLDDATYNGDASAPSGTVAYVEPVLSWEGPLAAGESVELTYSVTVNDPLTGDGTLNNVVVGPPESNCDDPASTDPDCVDPNPIKALEIVKQAAPGDEVLPGGTVQYTVTVTNTGVVAYTDADPASFEDDLSEVLDDAVYNGDASAPSGTVEYMEPVLSWSGALEAGASVDVTYTVTVNDPLSGDGTLDNGVTGPPESNCADGSTDPDCETSVPVKALEIAKVVSPADEVLPGGTLTYTVTVTNTGQVAYSEMEPAAVEDDLSDVLDDAAYNGDASAPSGTVSYASPILSWEGALEVGASVDIVYTVTVNDPLTGDGSLINGVTGPPESNCDDGTEEDCTTNVPINALEISKVSSPVGDVQPGETMTYTVSVENIGQVDQPTLVISDDLSEVIDDAVMNGVSNASTGSYTYEEPQLSWTLALDAGDSATLTYSVTVNDPLTGDGVLTNGVVGPPESNCPVGSQDPACTTEVPVKALQLQKSSDGLLRVRPGDTVTYEVSVTNTGQVPYTLLEPATWTDDLSAVLDDATYEDDASASGGTLSYVEPVLSWSGALAPGETVTVTYSVVVNDPASGDGELDNTVVGPSESNCTDPDSTSRACHEHLTLRAMEVVKTADVEGSVTVGDVVTYTVTVTNTGDLPYHFLIPARFDDDLTDVLDDATYNDDAVASVGTVTYSEPVLSWTGPLAPGESATVTYSVTVDDAPEGDVTLRNAVTSRPESNCPVVDEGGLLTRGFGFGVTAAAPDMPEGCQVITPIRMYEVSKAVDETAADPGDVVEYTVTVESTGTAPYTDAQPAGFSDDLSEVLDDATFNDDAVATAGATAYAEPTLTWSGPLEVDGTVTVTYSVTIDDPVSGDFSLANVAVPTEGGGTCTAADACETTTEITPPDPEGGLSDTGAQRIVLLAVLAGVLSMAGTALVITGRQRRWGTSRR